MRSAKTSMKPILILQHAANDWPDYFETFLKSRELPYMVVNAGMDEPVPQLVSGFGGLAVMGGAMGANDEALFPFLKQEYQLIEQALKAALPVIGHCLGGQMLARALGGTVSHAKTKEVGWHAVEPQYSPTARNWLGAGSFMAMQWHYDEFTLPAGAEPLATSLYCPQQAFLYDGIHLGMQFHIEAQAQKIERWIADVRSDKSMPNESNIHSNERIRADTQQWASKSAAMADRIYTRWLNGLPA
jgi:GMP synthase-like glutamine amidotransferase